MRGDAFGVGGKAVPTPGWQPVLHLGPRVIPPTYTVRLPRAVNRSLRRGGAFRISGAQAQDSAATSVSLFDGRATGTSLVAVSAGDGSFNRFEAIVYLLQRSSLPTLLAVGGYFIGNGTTNFNNIQPGTISVNANAWALPYEVRYASMPAGGAGGPNLYYLLVEVLNPVP